MVEELSRRFDNLDSGLEGWRAETCAPTVEHAAKLAGEAIRATIAPDLANTLTTRAQKNPNALLRALLTQRA